MRVTDEQHQSLWLLTFGPVIWAAHFIGSYAAVSIWCGRFTADGSLGPTPWIIAALTAVALAGIGLVAWGGWHRHSRDAPAARAPHDADTPEDRHRFLGLATLMLAGLSAIATAYVAAATVFFGTCR